MQYQAAPPTTRKLQQALGANGSVTMSGVVLNVTVATSSVRSDAEAGKLAEALAAARAEAKRLGEELKSTAPALAEAQSALKRERANLKRLQELCDRLKDERADAAALEKARDEALANAFAAAVLENKLRTELEGERAKTQAQAARVLAAESAAAEARAQAQRFEGQVMELTAAIEALQRQLNQRGPRVSGASLRQLEAAARELYISGGRHIEGFLSALAKLDVEPSRLLN